MTDLRVVSLAPSATATLAAMDAADRLVGVTQHCPVDASAEDPARPTLIGGWLNPDPDRIDGLDPDLVLTSDALQAEIAEDLDDRGFDVHHSEPATLQEAIDSFVDLGIAIDRSAAGKALAAGSRDRLDAVERALANSVSRNDRPVVYCEEWSDPPMAAGNWVPDVVEAAGGHYPFLDAGERSREIDGDAVVAADPDHVILHVCGHGERSDPAVVRGRDWSLDAPVHVIDDSLLNQPSPALIDGVETLARLFHPNAFDDATR